MGFDEVLEQQVRPAYSPGSHFNAGVLVPMKLATAVHSPIASKRTLLRFLEMVNKSAGTIDIGLGPVLTLSKWIAGQWDDAAAGSDFTDDTVDAQDAGANDFALTTLTNNDGFVIAADPRVNAPPEDPFPFSTVRIAVGTAAAGGTPVYEYTYWNGSAWAALTLIDTPVYSAAADTYLTFIPPTDWAPFAAATEGIPAGKYAIRMRATTAPTITAALATAIYVSHAFKWMIREVAADQRITFATAGSVLALNEPSEQLIAYFGTADAANSVHMIGDDH